MENFKIKESFKYILMDFIKKKIKNLIIFEPIELLED